MAGDGWIDAVHRFWFQELRPARWFKADPALDDEIRRRFGALQAWMAEDGREATSAPEALSGVIVLDQFSRNLFRGDARAFATDPPALARADRAITAGFDRGLSGPERQFLYMPFMHSEDPAMQDRALALFATVDVPGALKSAREHKTIIDRFGRFPGRNAALGRASTPEELAFLSRPRGF